MRRSRQQNFFKNDQEDVVISKKPKFFGVVYDVGLNFKSVHDMGLNAPDGLSVENFDPVQVEYEIRTIRNSLHCNAIRIEGEPIDRLVTASRIAHDHGLKVFFNPWKMNADAAELRPYYAEAAKEAEKLREAGVDIVFVAGCEYPMFQKGVVPGDTIMARIGELIMGATPEQIQERAVPMWEELNKILKSFVDVIRPEFKGPVTYAATALEQVDWSMFDIVGVDHYRGGESTEEYVEKFNSYKVHDKPVVCMEVGACTFAGAAERGGGAFLLLEGTNPDGSGRFKDGVTPTRSEKEQADYVETQVTLLADNDADGIFVYVFSHPLYTHGSGTKDLDSMSYSLVKTYPKDDPRSKEMPPWAPKEAFHRLASLYSEVDRLRS